MTPVQKPISTSQTDLHGQLRQDIKKTTHQSYLNGERTVEQPTYARKYRLLKCPQRTNDPSVGLLTNTLLKLSCDLLGRLVSV